MQKRLWSWLKAGFWPPFVAGCSDWPLTSAACKFKQFFSLLTLSLVLALERHHRKPDLTGKGFPETCHCPTPASASCHTMVAQPERNLHLCYTDRLLSPRDWREQVRLLTWSWEKLLRWDFRSYKNSLLLWLWEVPLAPCCCLASAFGICREAELQGLKCACFSSYHSKEVGKEMVTHFPYQLPYIKRVICLSGYGVAEVCNWLSAS